MNLLSIYYWPFILLTLIPYYFFNKKAQNLFLLILSFIFLLITSISNLLIFVFISTLSFFISKKLSQFTYKKILLSAYTLLLICLIFIKRENIYHLLGISYLGLTSLGYLLDVYWKRVQNPIKYQDYLLLLVFYPLSSLGPILSINKIKNQIQEKRNYLTSDILEGFYRIALGLLKITAVANKLSPLITHKPELLLSLQGPDMLLYCTLSYFMLYCEFSGYIDIVIGVSRLYGLKVPENFNAPYLSKNISDIWQRWHISLTSWLKEYVAFPLMLKYRNFLLSTFISILGVALWHGVNKYFIYWALYWMFFYVLYVLCLKLFSKKTFPLQSINNFSKIALTFLITIFSTLSFFLGELDLSLLLKNLFTLAPFGIAKLTGTYNFYYIEVMLALIAIITLELTSKKRSNMSYISLIGLIFFFIALFGISETKSLMYFNL